MTEIHPIFNQILDKSMARACSEIMLPGVAKFSSTPELHQRYDSQDFPPTPSYTTSILATYLEENTSRGSITRTQFFGLGDERIHIPIEALSRLYQETISRNQESLPLLHTMLLGKLATNQPSEGYHRLQSWYINLVRSSKSALLPNGGRLLSAHITHQAAKDGYFFDTVVTPTCVMQELPLLVRENISQTLSYIQNNADSSEVPYELTQLLQEQSRPLLQNDPSVMILGEIASSSFLPSPNVVLPMLKKSMPNRSSVDGLNRAARRKKNK